MCHNMCRLLSVPTKRFQRTQVHVFMHEFTILQTHWSGWPLETISYSHWSSWPLETLSYSHWLGWPLETLSYSHSDICTPGAFPVWRVSSAHSTHTLPSDWVTLQRPQTGQTPMLKHRQQPKCKGRRSCLRCLQLQRKINESSVHYIIQYNTILQLWLATCAYLMYRGTTILVLSTHSLCILCSTCMCYRNTHAWINDQQWVGNYLSALHI